MTEYRTEVTETKTHEDRTLLQYSDRPLKTRCMHLRIEQLLRYESYLCLRLLHITVTITVLTRSSCLRVCLCGRSSVFVLFMLHTAASNIFVLLTFGQPTFKVLFNLSKRCRGSERHLNNTVSASILPSVLGAACRQSTIYSLLHQKKTSLYLGFKEQVYIYF